MGKRFEETLLHQRKEKCVRDTQEHLLTREMQIKTPVRY